ncbi:MAG: hypothetical protein ACOZBL_05195 [Patescibacteria group bacterium]
MIASEIVCITSLFVHKDSKFSGIFSVGRFSTDFASTGVHTFSTKFVFHSLKSSNQVEKQFTIYHQFCAKCFINHTLHSHKGNIQFS